MSVFPCLTQNIVCRFGLAVAEVLDFFNIGLVIPPCSYPFSLNSEKKTPPETLATAE